MDDDQRMAINKLRDLCRKLPKAHYYTLGYLMHHLSRVAAEHEANSMTASNLAIVFAPTLMKTNKDIGLGAVDETKHYARVIELLIFHATHIFGPPELVAPRETGSNDQPHQHHRGSRMRGGVGNRSRGSRDSSDLISSQTERRGEVNDEFSIPGLVSGNEDLAAGSNEDICSVSDEDDDADPIPIFLLEGGNGARPGRSPMLMRGNSSPPLIIKQSLKNFSGLEGVTPGMLSTQDSLEAAQAQKAAAAANSGAGPPTTPLVTQASMPPMMAAVTAKRTIHQESSMPVASTMEVSTAVFHKMGKVTKKNSIEGSDPIFGDGESGSEVNENSSKSSTSPPSVVALRPSSSSGAGSSGRSGSLSEETGPTSASASHHSGSGSTRRRPGGKDMTQSMPATILNLEENRVTIQVPGVQAGSGSGSTAVHLPSRSFNHPPAVVKQSSIDRDED